jgi:hypothetical protein
VKLNIIDLPHRIDRLELLNRELQEQQIVDYKIWAGIIDSELPCRGISKAHKVIIKFAKKENLSEILIAEDDIHFTSSGAFKYFLDNKPQDYDLYLGGINWGKINEDNSVNDFSGNTFYMVNNKFYETILSPPEEKDFDRIVANRGKFFVCNPMVAIQHNGFSDNQKNILISDLTQDDKSCIETHNEVTFSKTRLNLPL